MWHFLGVPPSAPLLVSGWNCFKSVWKMSLVFYFLRPIYFIFCLSFPFKKKYWFLSYATSDMSREHVGFLYRLSSIQAFRFDNMALQSLIMFYEFVAFIQLTCLVGFLPLILNQFAMPLFSFLLRSLIFSFSSISPFSKRIYPFCTPQKGSSRLSSELYLKCSPVS